MKSPLVIRLRPTHEQFARLQALQITFAQVCNALTPIVSESRCWNRVALHHMTYYRLREQFPQVGSQMICNAIYSVSRMCRRIFQHPGSPLHITKLHEEHLPILKFLPSAPVYFDRHTLSVKGHRLSLYTLDGRLHFDISLNPSDETRFHQEKLREIALRITAEEVLLTFSFGLDDAAPATDVDAADTAADWPEYLIVMDAENIDATQPREPGSATPAGLHDRGPVQYTHS